MGDDNAKHGVAQKLESLIRFQALAGALVHVRGVDERFLEEGWISKLVAEGRVERSERRGGRFSHRAWRCMQGRASLRRGNHTGPLRYPASRWSSAGSVAPACRFRPSAW